MMVQDAPFVLDKSTFFKGAKRKRASAAGAALQAGCLLMCTFVSRAQQPAGPSCKTSASVTAGDAGPPQPGQRPSSAGARPPAAAAAAAPAPCANEGVLADDDDDDINVFGQFQYLP
jgi:hypothetical protein